MSSFLFKEDKAKMLVAHFTLLKLELDKACHIGLFESADESVAGFNLSEILRQVYNINKYTGMQDYISPRTFFFGDNITY